MIEGDLYGLGTITVLHDASEALSMPASKGLHLKVEVVWFGMYNHVQRGL
jgi:hypothetical protein